MRTGYLTIVFILLSTPVLAQGSGFEMLNISPTPNSLSKAEAATTLADGSASIYSNPALLAYANKSSIDLGYSFWIADVDNIFGGVNFLRNRSAVAFSFYTSGSSEYQQFVNPGEPNGSFSIQYLSIAAAYAYNFKYFTIGATAQYLNEENFTYNANGYAFNVGLASQFFNDRLRLGTSLTNLGEMEKLNIESTQLPSTYRAGISADLIEFTAQRNGELPILISAYADFISPLQETSGKDFADYSASENYVNLGLKFMIAEVLELSSGYKTQNNVRPISFGAGFSTDEITFNYALIPFNTGYGTVHSIGIQYKF
ncbi:PorV/PorQ family protein [Gracilimonas halophila]|uniref:PorV/PorQ family protein n=1 Tax=Gracilimonas halophila TaxID=1834464 RepID=A0ABW5JJH2_9BACT